MARVKRSASCPRRFFRLLSTRFAPLLVCGRQSADVKCARCVFFFACCAKADCSRAPPQVYKVSCSPLFRLFAMTRQRRRLIWTSRRRRQRRRRLRAVAATEARAAARQRVYTFTIIVSARSSLATQNAAFSARQMQAKTHEFCRFAQCWYRKLSGLAKGERRAPPFADVWPRFRLI